MNKKRVVSIIIWFLIALLGMNFFYKNHLSPKRLVVMGVIFIIALFIQIKRNMQNEDYLVEQLGITQNSNRVCHYDWLRLIAVCMVIVTHAVQIDISMGLVSGQYASYFMTIIYTICLACNLIYVMLSGALLLPWKEEKLSDFYLRRVSKVAFPIVVYYTFYMWQNGTLGKLSVDSMLGLLKNLYTANVPESPHFWLVYTILGIYIVIPFFRYMFKDLPYRMLTYLVVISLIFMGITILVPIRFGVSTFMASWIGVAVMGYWVTRPETKRYYKILVCAGIVGVILIALLIKLRSDFLGIVTGCSPIMCAVSLGIFAFVFMLPKFFGKGNIMLSVLSKYSYSIILLHWWSLNWVTRIKYGITVCWHHGIGLIISLLVTLLVSLFAAVIIDNMIMVVINTLYDNILIRMKRKDR